MDRFQTAPTPTNPPNYYYDDDDDDDDDDEEEEEDETNTNHHHQHNNDDNCDNYDIADLLKHVAMRNDSSLSGEQREEVENMVKRVELYRGRHTVAGKLKIHKHDAETFVKKQLQHTTLKHAKNDDGGSGGGGNDHQIVIEHESLGRRLKNAKEPTKISESVTRVGDGMNKMGKDLVQKFSKEKSSSLMSQKEQITSALSSAATPSKSKSKSKSKPSSHTPIQVLQKLGAMNLKPAAAPSATQQVPSATPSASAATTTQPPSSSSSSSMKDAFAKKRAEQVEKMKEAYERSQQENSKKMQQVKERIGQSQQKGKQSMKNLGANFKKNLQNLETFLISSSNGTTTTETEDEWIAKIEHAEAKDNYEKSVAAAAAEDIDDNKQKQKQKQSIDYKREVKGIQLLQKIFPKESSDSLIKLRFHRDASNK